MKKYITVLLLNWENGLVYRTSVILWRFRQFLGTLMSLTVWTVIFQNNPTAFNYTKDSMISYVFIIGFLQSLIISTALNGLAHRIYSGEISNYLLKPINLFGYLATEEVADKIKNVIGLILETVILFFIFLPNIQLPSALLLIFFVSTTLLGVVLNFFITLLFGCLGFWSPDTWAPKFLFFMVLDFTAGKLFPLDILPTALQNFLYLTPFPYLSFTQTQIFLGRLTTSEIVNHMLIQLFWIGLLGSAVRYLWRFGLKNYESTGR